jgi:hypothetical protein
MLRAPIKRMPSADRSLPEYIGPNDEIEQERLGTDSAHGLNFINN